jgi:hypothetical protein
LREEEDIEFSGRELGEFENTVWVGTALHIVGAVGSVEFVGRKEAIGSVEAVGSVKVARSVEVVGCKEAVRSVEVVRSMDISFRRCFSAARIQDLQESKKALFSTKMEKI